MSREIIAKTYQLRPHRQAAQDFEGDILIALLRPIDMEALQQLSPTLAKAVDCARDCGDLFRKSGQSFWVYAAMLAWGDEEPLRAKRILFVGMEQDTAESNEEREQLRIAAGLIAQECKRLDAARLLLFVPLLCSASTVSLAQHLVEGLILGDYSFEGYKNPSKKKNDRGWRQAAFLVDRQKPWPKALGMAMRQGRALALATAHARDMAQRPANDWTPAAFAAQTAALAKRKGLKALIFDQARLTELGMGGILAVSQGSAQSPYLCILEYGQQPEHPTVMLVGKGLTFDSGGLCAKPALGMEEMKYDMCGGAAVLAAMEAIAKLGLSGVNVVALVPASENLSGSAALKPGDVIRHYGGVSSEVVNTDAEGRLILADALAYGIAAYQPDAIIDIATLTGAAIIALGHHRSGLFSNDDALADALLAAGAEAGEPMWRLPLGAEYRKLLDSKVADLKNMGDRSAGAIAAACYLQEFVADIPWAHLDIAGTAWNFTEKSYIPKGPSGIGVRTFITLLRQWKPLKRNKKLDME